MSKGVGEHGAVPLSQNSIVSSLDLKEYESLESDYQKYKESCKKMIYLGLGTAILGWIWRHEKRFPFMNSVCLMSAAGFVGSGTRCGYKAYNIKYQLDQSNSIKPVYLE